MIRKPITLPQEFKNYIEALYYEKESREKLLLFMFEQDNCNIERFNQIHEEYVDFYAQCDTAKDFLEKVLDKSAPICPVASHIIYQIIR